MVLFNKTWNQKFASERAETYRREHPSRRAAIKGLPECPFSRGQLNGEPLGDVAGLVFRLQT